MNTHADTDTGNPPTNTAANAAFTLPDGRLIDGNKNTLQSFHVPDGHIENRTAKPPLSTNRITDPSAVAAVDTVNDNYHYAEDGAIRAQAVPIQSLIIAEGVTFHSGIRPPPNPTATKTTPPPEPAQPAATLSTAFWIAIVFVIISFSLAAGIGGYCGAGNCSSSNNSSSSSTTADNNAQRPIATTSSPIPMTLLTPTTVVTSPVIPPSSLAQPPSHNPATTPIVSPTKETPTLSPTTSRGVDTDEPSMSVTNVPTIDLPLVVACNFLSFTNVTECQATTQFIDDGSTTTGTTIPSEIGLLIQLSHLDLSNEKLSGTIPDTIGNWFS